MSKIQETVHALEQALRALKPHEAKETVAPQEGRFYTTFNGSIVFVASVDRDEDGICVVLKGGHGVSHANGEKPGERYLVDDEGYFKSQEPGIVTVMSLMEELDLELPEIDGVEMHPAVNQRRRLGHNRNSVEDIPF